MRIFLSFYNIIYIFFVYIPRHIFCKKASEPPNHLAYVAVSDMGFIEAMPSCV